MKAGTPIITTNVGGNPEVIDNNQNGLLVGFNNQTELIEAAIKILADEQLANSLVASAKEKLNTFNWTNTVEGTIKVIKEVIYE